MIRAVAVALCAASLCALTGCFSGCVVGPRAQIEASLQIQADAWNAGDIPAFMQYYWNDPALTFSSGGETRKGWQATHDRFVRRYPDKAAMGKLDFKVDQVEMLGSHAAYVLGRWHLTREEPIGGNFSLVWRKLPEGWRIVHDHTSVLPP